MPLDDVGPGTEILNVELFNKIIIAANDRGRVVLLRSAGVLGYSINNLFVTPPELQPGLPSYLYPPPTFTNVDRDDPTSTTGGAYGSSGWPGFWSTKGMGEIQSLLNRIHAYWFDDTRYPEGFNGNFSDGVFGDTFRMNTFHWMRYLGIGLPDAYPPRDPPPVPGDPDYQTTTFSDYFDATGTTVYDFPGAIGYPVFQYDNDSVIQRTSVGSIFARRVPRRIFTLDQERGSEAHHDDHVVGNLAQYYPSGFASGYRGIYEYRGGGEWTLADDRSAMADTLDSREPWLTNNWCPPGTLGFMDYFDWQLFDNVIKIIRLMKRTYNSADSEPTYYAGATVNPPTSFFTPTPTPTTSPTPTPTPTTPTNGYWDNTYPTDPATAGAEALGNLATRIAEYPAADEDDYLVPTPPAQLGGNKIGTSGTGPVFSGATYKYFANAETIRQYALIGQYQGIAHTTEYNKIMIPQLYNAPETRQLTHLGYETLVWKSVGSKSFSAGEHENIYECKLILDFPIPAFFGASSNVYAVTSFGFDVYGLTTWDFD